MYESGPAIEIYTADEPYGYDECMYFLEGGVNTMFPVEVHGARERAATIEL